MVDGAALNESKDPKRDRSSNGGVEDDNSNNIDDCTKKAKTVLPRAGPMKYVAQGLPVPNEDETSSSGLNEHDTLSNIAGKTEHDSRPMYPDRTAPMKSISIGGESVGVIDISHPDGKQFLLDRIEDSKKVARGEYKFPPKPWWMEAYDKDMAEQRAAEKAERERKEEEAIISKET